MNNKKIQFLTDSSESSDTESIGDELNLSLLKSVEDDKQLLIQKQIEDDLATHDFSKCHVDREQIQELLGMRIKNVSYYQRALVHKSIYKSVKRYSAPAPLQEYLLQHNERLEFLGDSVLGLIIANYLYHRYPDQDEGFMTRIKTKLVNGTQLANLARQIDLGKYILMSNHVQNIKGRNSQKILEDAFEAFLAAIFKDLGFDAANAFVIKLIEQLDFTEVLLEDNYKDLLLKFSQMHFKNCTPEYSLVYTEGPPHNRTFCVKASINGKVYEQGIARSKKQAEQIAAQKTLILLKK
uniref:ribonuclease III n=1 Tax=viral metagenome TaxID=1070528 RepID=A0A6C0I8U6_9ZZZZ